MQSIKTVLKIYNERGKEGKTLERLYEQLYKPEMYAEAYSRTYANRGALTRGNSEETMDSMSQERWDSIIQRLKNRSYHWTPPRYQNIPKANGGTRRLGIPSGDDKILQSALKVLLEAYYEPTFSDRSHGFRPNRGCHSALIEVRQKHKAVSWWIEGDIKSCFDRISHETLLEIMGEKIKDRRILNLIKKLLASGHLENWEEYDNPSGTPQGGVISPLLANIYMDVFDKWVENDLMPRYNYSQTKKGGRRTNPVYNKLCKAYAKARKVGNREYAREIRKKMKATSTVMVDDEGYRKLAYIRYADDFLLGFAGPKSEAIAIKEEIRRFLNDRLKLELSKEKTLITHARTQKARFLGYDVGITHTKERRIANGTVWLGVPKEVVTKAIKKYSRKGKPHHLGQLQNESDYHIVSSYQSRYRGIVQYYIMAHNISKLSRVKYTMETSMLKTLAAKHKTSVNKIAKKYKTTVDVNGKGYVAFQVVVEREGKNPLTTHWGAIPLTRNPVPAKITDRGSWIFYSERCETLWRLLAENCEMCGEERPLEAHHVHALKDVKKGKAPWQRRMSALKRKTLMVCWPCHKAITYNKHPVEWETSNKNHV